MLRVDTRYTLRHLEYFVAVADCGTIRSAAQICHVSQPAVSQGIAELERGLGVQLIIRNRARGIVLTPAGRRLLAPVKALLSEAGELQLLAVSEGGEIAGKISVGCYVGLSPLLTPKLLVGFKKAYPDVDLDFEENPQPELQQSLLSGHLDLALMYDHGIPVELEKIMLARQRPHVLLSESHPMAGLDAVSLRDLSTEPMVLLDVSPSRDNWRATVSNLGLDPVVGFRTQNFELTRCLVGQGLGYAVLIQKPVSNITYDGTRVVAKPILEETHPSGIVIAYPRGSKLTPRATAFIEHCRTVMEPVSDK